MPLVKMSYRENPSVFFFRRFGAQLRINPVMELFSNC